MNEDEILKTIQKLLDENNMTLEVSHNLKIKKLPPKAEAPKDGTSTAETPKKEETE